ncbi:mannose-ethanolamine phosphotransferase gpi13, partial [Coemansia furcata]
MARAVATFPVRGLWTVSTVLILASVAGFWLFSRGFLLTRMVLPHHSDPSRLPFANDTTQVNDEWYPAKFERAIILVVDALRIDYATWSPELDTLSGEHRLKPYHNRLPIIEALNSKSPDQTMLYRFRADPPTTTLQRLKGLTTGQLPTFIDAGSNFAGSAIDEDNWLQGLRRPRRGGGHGRNLVFLGDDTWTSLFPVELSDTRAMELNDTLWRAQEEEGRGWARVRPFPSLNVWDLDTVDDGVFSRLPFFLLPPDPPQAAAADVQAKREKWRGLVRQQEMLAHPDIDAPSESMASAAVSLEQLHSDWD